jgi:hypothetical protein
MKAWAARPRIAAIPESMRLRRFRRAAPDGRRTVRQLERRLQQFGQKRSARNIPLVY